MDLTCLSKGGGFHYPPCHMLNVCGFQILLDCPLDLSALSIFSPVPMDSNAVLDEEFDYDSTTEIVESNCTGVGKGKKRERPLSANDLVNSEPYYKTVNSLYLGDLSSIDAVLISSPMGMLGLPYLTRVAGFSAKIYATEAAARIGQLIMENLVTMHMEHRQFYGAEESQFPEWMKSEKLEVLPQALKEIALGQDGSDIGGWMALYSAVDVKDCMQKIQALKYCEETCHNGTLILKPFSSGLEIGSCNWTINSPKGNIACLSSSIFVSSHALNFDLNGLRGYDFLLFSDFSHDLIGDMDNSNHCTQAGSNFSTMSDVMIAELLLNTEDNMEEMEKFSFITSAAIDSIKAGGSVLIPIGRLGIILQLLESISSCLDSLNMKVPIYFISSIAEELLAFSNIIPEWLCKARQEKLYSGQSLFAHVQLIEEKKLHLFADVHSHELLKIWEEPCIVFCSHWSLRLGPVVHLLRHWSNDPHSLLVMESGADADLAFLPFKPMSIKVLQCSFHSGMRMQNVQPLLRLLRPKFVLVPEHLARHCDFSRTNSTPFIHYFENRKVQIPNSGLKSVELDIATDLACMHLDWTELKRQNMNVAKLKGELIVEQNKHLLLLGDSGLETSQGRHFTLQWGSFDLQNLVGILQKMGINASLERAMVGTDSEHTTIHVLEPNRALIEIKDARTIISTADENLASLIFEAICKTLNGI